jgi:hypothetical protein
MAQPHPLHRHHGQHPDNQKLKKETTLIQKKKSPSSRSPSHHDKRQQRQQQQQQHLRDQAIAEGPSRFLRKTSNAPFPPGLKRVAVAFHGECKVPPMPNP